MKDEIHLAKTSRKGIVKCFLFLFSFMAAVLTAVLQYHLAWVSTVMPAGTAPSRAYLDKHSSKTVRIIQVNLYLHENSRSLQELVYP